jgi:hypothetical protein
MTLRIAWRSFLQPLGHWPSVALLVVPLLALWAVAAVAMPLREHLLPLHDLQRTGLTITIFLLVPALVLATPLIRGEAWNGLLKAELMLPVSRGSYYTGRVLGRACLALLHGLLAVGGLAVIATMTGTEMPPGTGALLAVKGLGIVAVVASLAALAPLTSGRLSHLACWIGLFILAQQALLHVATAKPPLLLKPLLFFSTEVLAPFLIGATPMIVEEAAFGPWFLGRALLQWGFGLALAWLIGLSSFSRMEVAAR